MKAFSLESPFQKNSLPDVLIQNQEISQTVIVRTQEAAQLLAIASSLYPFDTQYLFLKFVQTLEVIEKISWINIDYGPEVQYILNSFAEKEVSIDHPEDSEERDRITAMSKTSAGKLTKYYIPLTLDWFDCFKILVYVVSFLFKIPLG